MDSLRTEGFNRQLISLPTGCGKTVIFALLAKKLNVRTLVLAHTEELITQAVNKFKIVWENVDIGVVKAHHNSFSSQVVVASVQTASKLKRLNSLKEQNFGLLIIDEAHHATSASYQKVIEELGFFQDNPYKLLVGVTATPKRSDGIGLKVVFQKIAFECSINTMIKSGYLSPLIGKQVFTKIELSSVGVSQGDFIQSELANLVNTSARNNLVVEKYLEYASDRKKTLVFCVNVQHAKDLALAFKNQGISAESVYGAMPKDKRAAVLQNFSNGEYKVITNCQLLTEGFDAPEIDCVVLGRPTQSTALFTQMIGRGARTFPLKKNCFVLDFTDNTKKHNLCTFKNTLNGAVTPLIDPESIEIENECLGLPEEEKTLNKQPNFEKILEERIEEISFFDNVQFAWTPVKDSWHLNLGSGKEVWVTSGESGFQVKAYNNNQQFILSKQQLPLSYALGIAEDWARKHSTKSTWARKDATWRTEPATQKQKETLSNLGVSFAKEISKGHACQLIELKLNEPPTKNQIYWLQSRGIVFNQNISKKDATKLIYENVGKNFPQTNKRKRKKYNV